MRNVEKFHQRAMDLAEKAFIAKLEGDLKKEQDLLRKAFEQENQAARLIAKEEEVEPSRSILHRSAATLAIDCGKIEEGKRLIETALSGKPPKEIEDELKDLSQQLNFLEPLLEKGKEFLSSDPADLEAVLECMQAALEIQPDHEDANDLHHFALKQLGQTQELSKSQEETLRLYENPVFMREVMEILNMPIEEFQELPA